MDELNVDLLKRANIDENSISKTVQVLNFDESVKDSSKIKLLELDKDLLKILERNENISFRGDKKEQVVFCSEDKTYDVKLADISNSMILVPNFKFAKETDDPSIESKHVFEDRYIRGIYHQYYELTQCPPKLSKLPLILEPSLFKGLEFEKLVRKEDLYDWKRLTSEIQASDAEIRNSFEDLSIAEIDGFYRIVSFQYEAQALSLMLDFVEENSWKPDEVDKAYTYHELSQFIPRSVFDLIFHKYTDPVRQKDAESYFYKFNDEKCCKLVARMLLTVHPVTELKHFMLAWNRGTPDYMTPKQEYLNGVAIVVFNAAKQTQEVIVFSESNLPDNIEDRFTELFKVKDKWTFDEIAPYLKKLCTLKVNENVLLTKFARTSKINGVKYYSSKHNK